MSPADDSILVGDFGGTNARFAVWHNGGHLEKIVNWRCADFPSLADALEAYLAEVHESIPKAAAIAVGGPVTKDAVRFTNSEWSFSISALRSQFAFEPFLVINDAAALAYATTILTDDALEKIGGGAPAHAPKVVAVPGTGLGIGAAVPGGKKWHPVETEGGHISLAAGTDHEQKVIAQLRRRFGHVSAERALSGPGIVNLYIALAEIRGGSHVERIEPHEVTQDVTGPNADPLCRAAIDLFADLLGSTCGDLALTYGSRGGVFLTGGAFEAAFPNIDRARMRARFEDKGRFRDYLAPIPIYRIRHSHPSLIGLGAMAKGLGA